MSDNNRFWAGVGFGCAGFAILGVVCCGGVLIYFGMGPEGRVRLGPTMEEYALEYIDEHQLIDPGETIDAYYDVTISLDSTECAILTDRRLIYHRNGTNTEMARGDILFVESEDLGMMGEGLTVEDRNGNVIYIEIAALNDSHLFRNALERAADDNNAAE